MPHMTSYVVPDTVIIFSPDKKENQDIIGDSLKEMLQPNRIFPVACYTVKLARAKLPAKAAGKLIRR